MCKCIGRNFALLIADSAHCRALLHVSKCFVGDDLFRYVKSSLAHLHFTLTPFYLFDYVQIIFFKLNSEMSQKGGKTLHAFFKLVKAGIVVT